MTGCVTERSPSLCRMRIEMKTLRSLTEKLRILRAGDGGGLSVESPDRDVSWEIWTAAKGPSTHLVVS